MAVKPRTRNEMAARLAADIPDGWYVNLGIGLPTLVAGYVARDREVMFHSENGILGMGPAPAPDRVDPWLVNAGKAPVTLNAGAALFDHALSFTMIRGGHLDLCVLGAYEVAANGDIANWSTADRDMAPAVGGAMDLAAGAKALWVLMEHTTKEGRPRIVERCAYPLTAVGVVTRIYTDLAVIEVGPQGLALIDTVPELPFAELQAKTGAPLRPARG